jgi:hypothetical protein
VIALSKTNADQQVKPSQIAEGNARCLWLGMVFFLILTPNLKIFPAAYFKITIFRTA